MGANHSHGQSAPGSRRAIQVTLAVIIPLALATLTALIWMWPAAPKPADDVGSPLIKVNGTITYITSKPCSEPTGEARGCDMAMVQLTSGDLPDQNVSAEIPGGRGSPKFEVGDDVILIYTPGDPLGQGSDSYQLSDHDRSSPMWLVGAAFVLAVIAFGRLRGLMALVGLAVTFALLLLFLIPAILAGEPPLLVAIVCAAAIMLSVLYLTHGFTLPTSIAVIGTLASLTLTGVLAVTAIALTHLNGITDDSSLYLDLNYEINTQGLLLASIIIGSLGVLDDVTVTQAVTVSELAHANPSFSPWQLYRAAARVGRAHIASVINTIILAYSGSALPLLLLFSIGNQPLGDVLTGPVVAQEIVRSVAGTLGLIAAVPITTALSALTATRRSSVLAFGPESTGEQVTRTVVNDG